MAPIVFSWPLSSNVPRNFWWHMDTSMYPPSDRRRILSSRSLQHTKCTSTSVLDGVYPSIGRLFAFQLAYLYTTTAISSDYYFFLLLSWTMYSAIYTPFVSYYKWPYYCTGGGEGEKIWNNFWKCFLLFIGCLKFVLIYIFRITTLFLDN